MITGLIRRRSKFFISKKGRKCKIDKNLAYKMVKSIESRYNCRIWE